MQSRFGTFLNYVVSMLEQFFLQLTQPSRHSLALSMTADLPRGKSELIAENALLRQQIIVLRRHIKKPRLTPSDLFGLPYSLPAFNTGNIPSFSSNQIPCCAGIVKGSASSGLSNLVNAAAVLSFQSKPST
jgi:hypothetical protein